MTRTVDPSRPHYVEQLMSRAVATCRPDDSLNAAARIMWEHDCGVVPITVVDEGGERVVGMITDRDVCMAAYTQGRPLRDIAVTSAMSGRIHACHPKDRIAAALERMATEQLHRLPVVDSSGFLVGLLSLADIAREEARRHRVISAGDLARSIEAISTPRPHDVAPITTASWSRPDATRPCSVARAI
jgi:CBS domain-containing protein